MLLRQLLFYCSLAIFIFSRFFLCSVEYLTPIVVSKLPHHLPAFTQGLAIKENLLYESTGIYGQSSLRKLDISTGRILQKKTLPAEVFAEGVAIIAHQLFQITWKEKQARVYDRFSLMLQKTLSYSGEGWGLCTDGDTLWMSNGSPILTQRNPETFAVLTQLAVKWEGRLIGNLNDLECVGNDLYANVWGKNFIIRINKQSGEVTGVIDASRLLSSEEKARLKVEDLLNGIAFHPETQTFFLTGKNWPWIFEVKWIFS